MGHSLFISDLHLSESCPQLCAAFETYLLKQASLAAELYILGDLVDSWVGDDDNSSFAVHLRSLLAGFTRNGCRLFLLHGNRDFMFGPTFCQLTGATLLPEASVIDLYGVPTLLLHGDSLCTDDGDYQRWRSLTRDPLWQQAQLETAIEQRRRTALALRSDSRLATAEKPDFIMDVNPQEVERVMLASGVRQMIHGHTHRPATHTLQLAGLEARRLVLGQWLDRGWAVRAEPGQLNLESFPL